MQTLILSLTFLGNGMFLVPDEKAEPIVLPKDSSAIVISLDYRGGNAKRKSDEPTLIVRADGRARVVDSIQGSVFESMIPPEDLQKVLRFILHDKDFQKLKSVNLEQTISQQKRKAGLGRMLDGGTTVVQIGTKSNKHQVDVYMLNFYATQFPKLPGLQRMHHIERRLDWLANVVRIGGFAELQRTLDLLNRDLQLHKPTKSTFEPTDLKHVKLREGRRLMRFNSQHGVQASVELNGTPRIWIDTNWK